MYSFFLVHLSESQINGIYTQRRQVLKMHYIREKITKSVCINATSLCSDSEPKWMLPNAGCQRLSIKNELCVKKQSKTQEATILLWGVSGERIDFPPWLSGWFFFSFSLTCSEGQPQWLEGATCSLPAESCASGRLCPAWRCWWSSGSHRWSSTNYSQSSPLRFLPHCPVLEEDQGD